MKAKYVKRLQKGCEGEMGEKGCKTFVKAKSVQQVAKSCEGEKCATKVAESCVGEK